MFTMSSAAELSISVRRRNMLPDQYTRKFRGLLHTMFLEQLNLMEVKRIGIMWELPPETLREDAQDASRIREKIFMRLDELEVIRDWIRQPSELLSVLEEDIKRLDLVRKVEEFRHSIAGWSLNYSCILECFFPFLDFFSNTRTL